MPANEMCKNGFDAGAGGESGGYPEVLNHRPDRRLHHCEEVDAWFIIRPAAMVPRTMDTPEKLFKNQKDERETVKPQRPRMVHGRKIMEQGYETMSTRTLEMSKRYQGCGDPGETAWRFYGVTSWTLSGCW